MATSPTYLLLCAKLSLFAVFSSQSSTEPAGTSAPSSFDLLSSVWGRKGEEGPVSAPALQSTHSIKPTAHHPAAISLQSINSFSNIARPRQPLLPCWPPATCLPWPGHTAGAAIARHMPSRQRSSVGTYSGRLAASPPGRVSVFSPAALSLCWPTALNDFQGPVPPIGREVTRHLCPG